jgi:hypothetical protein
MVPTKPAGDVGVERRAFASPGHQHGWGPHLINRVGVQ